MKYILSIIFIFLLSCTTNIYNSNPAEIANHNIGNAYKSVTLLFTNKPSGGTILATGFAYDKDHIITAGHFCISALKIQIFESHTNSIQMTYYDDDFKLTTKTKMEIEDLSDAQDLCMLKKKDHGLLPLPIAKNFL